jgi:spore maturation protein CgeB
MRVDGEAPRWDVLFLGHYEKNRGEDVAWLLQNGIDVVVGGRRDWRRGRHWSTIRRAFLEDGFWGEAYARALSSARIALCYYSRWNRDVENSRMYEIPACGTFMLAERNHENVKVFREGEEAEFFGSRDELLRKVRYYLKYPWERERVARKGRERCLSSGYSYHHRLSAMIREVRSLCEELRFGRRSVGRRPKLGGREGESPATGRSECTDAA